MNEKENETINECLEPKHEVSSLHADNMGNPGSLNDDSESQSAMKPSKWSSINIQELDFDLPEAELDDNNRKSFDIKSGEHKPSKKFEAFEEERRLLELQMKQTMEMYYAACKEALKEKEKNKELQLLMKEYERKLAKALVEKEEALAIAESEKAMRISATEAAKVSERKADEEMQKRNGAKRELLRETVNKRLILDSMSRRPF